MNNTSLAHTQLINVAGTQILRATLCWLTSEVTHVRFSEYLTSMLISTPCSPHFGGAAVWMAVGPGLAAAPGSQPEASSAERPGALHPASGSSRGWAQPAGPPEASGRESAGRGRRAQATIVGTWPVLSSSSFHSTRCLLPAQGTVHTLRPAPREDSVGVAPSLSCRRFEGSLSEPRRL